MIFHFSEQRIKENAKFNTYTKVVNFLRYQPAKGKARKLLALFVGKYKDVTAMARHFYV